MKGDHNKALEYAQQASIDLANIEIDEIGASGDVSKSQDIDEHSRRLQHLKMLSLAYFTVGDAEVK